MTEREVRARRERGEGNDAVAGSGRSYWSIARANVFTFFNNLLFTIGIALVALGQYSNAFVSVGLGLVHAVVSAVQEVNAKRKLDRIALLNRPTATVVREGKEKEIDPSALVLNDIVRVRGGDQIVVDGRVVGEGYLEMDESLLTGEPDLIQKRTGDALLSGSFCVSGDAFYEAEKVGAASFANRLTNTAREFRVERTPLQKKIDFVVRLNMLVVTLISLVILLQAALENLPFARIVQISAVLSGQVPYGLFFLVAVAYTLGASTLAKQGAALRLRLSAPRRSPRLRLLVLARLRPRLAARRPRLLRHRLPRLRLAALRQSCRRPVAALRCSPLVLAPCSWVAAWWFAGSSSKYCLIDGS